MIVTSKADAAKSALHLYLKAHGVEIPRSEDFQAIGRLNSGLQLMGVVGYNGFCGQVCTMHVAGEGNWLSRDLLRMAFDYPFNQVGVKHVFATVAANNLRALNFDRHLGFEVLHRLRDGWADGVDMIVLRMTRSQCRWLQSLEKKHELQAA